MVAMKKVDNYNQTYSDDCGSYYVTVTNEEVPIVLHEGVPHSATLENGFETQNYYYNHIDTNLPFKISVNAIGRLSIYINFAEINNSDLENVYYYKTSIVS